jgi:hypothetical protein
VKRFSFTFLSVLILICLLVPFGARAADVIGPTWDGITTPTNSGAVSFGGKFPSLLESNVPNTATLYPIQGDAMFATDTLQACSTGVYDITRWENRMAFTAYMTDSAITAGHQLQRWSIAVQTRMDANDNWYNVHVDTLCDSMTSTSQPAITDTVDLFKCLGMGSQMRLYAIGLGAGSITQTTVKNDLVKFYLHIFLLSTGYGR